MTYDRDLTDYPCNFDPEQTRFAKAFQNPISRALWIAYRGNHICAKSSLDALTFNSVKIAKEIESEPKYKTPEYKEKLKNLVRTELLLGSRGCHFSFYYNDIHEYFEFVYPYLIGEKIASIKIMSKEK